MTAEIEGVYDILHKEALMNISIEKRLKAALLQIDDNAKCIRREGAIQQHLFRRNAKYDMVCQSFLENVGELPSPELLSSAIENLRWSFGIQIDDLKRQLADIARSNECLWNGATFEYDEDKP